MLAIVVVAGCECRKPAPGPSVLGSETRAVVNGTPITGDEVAMHLTGRFGIGKPGDPATPAEALEDLVSEELLAQRALELGYQAEGSEVDAGAPADARTRDRRRASLAKQLRMKELLLKTAVGPEEVRAWFDANAARVQSELQVQQLNVQGREAGNAALAALAGGKSFEEVAAARVRDAGPQPAPWAAQKLGWSEVPPPWWPELDKLQAGQNSGLIAYQRDSFWIIKLVERKQDPAVTFEAVAPAIHATLLAAKFEERRDHLLKELRAKAKIELRATP